ncbi:hypothetical protein [Mesorhizobium cantuariense]|uniref:Uncharacterized protein n=1 Tax=Mesorhizobium cantuariense TaxID=1300275 RepID=A0ABV7MXD3_9HYPH
MLNEDTFKFEIGAWVTHVDHPMPSLVMERQMGRPKRGDPIEVYGVRSFAFEDQNRDRLMLGQFLKPIDRAAWDVCLFNTGSDVDEPA